MTTTARIAETYLRAVGGMDCTDRTSQVPEGIPGVWLPLPAWQALIDVLRDDVAPLNIPARAAGPRPELVK